MEPRSLKYVAEACAGQLVSGSPELIVQRVCTDSRDVKAGDLFFAIRGDRFDGHDFMDEVARRGAAAAVVQEDISVALAAGYGIVTVHDPRLALGALGTRYRADFNPTVIAVGGSNGKTTTKELLAAVLRQRFEVLASEASFNNDIGVPLTLLRLEAGHQFAVLEVGTNHPGELGPLVKMAQPRWGVITSIGREHLEFFGDLSGVIEEEGTLAELLPVEGGLFINADSPGVERIVERSRAPVRRVGLGPGSDWRAERVRITNEGSQFFVSGPDPAWAGEYRLNLLGRHQVSNALLAIAVGAEAGLAPDEVRRGLEICRPAKMRLESWVYDGVHVLNDAYNANADSVLAALQTLRDFPCTGRRIAVLGDMAELGQQSEAGHWEAGRFAGSLGLDQLFAVGKMAKLFGAAARENGLDAVSEFETVEQAAPAVKRFVRSGDVVLVKASRAARLERLADALRPG